MSQEFDRNKLREYIDAENGINYHRNIPLDGWTITYGDSFIAFSYREINNVMVAVIQYMYILNKDAMYQLMAYCINLWTGNNVKMVYYREHKRKSNVINTLTALDFNVFSVQKKNWKHPWVSTNGYKESDCLEAFPAAKEPHKSKKAAVGS